MSFSGVKAEGYLYDMKGATIGDDLVVTYNDGTSSLGNKLSKVVYVNNVKKGKATAVVTGTIIGKSPL